MDQFSLCPKCKFQTTDLIDVCPQCRGRMQKSTVIRRLGWVLVVMGAFLSLFMAGLAVFAGNIISSAGDPHASTRFTGTPQDMLFMFGIFGLVFVFGLGSLAAGIWQIKYGKRNAMLTMIVMVLGLVFIAVGLLLKAGGAN